MRTITVDQFRAEVAAQGVAREHAAFKCPICKTIQSSRDLVKAGAGPDFAAVERYLGFSCVGRFTNAGAYKKGEPPGRGCNWSLGGLFKLHELTVKTPDGAQHPHFELATPEEAKTHAQRHLAEQGV